MVKKQKNKRLHRVLSLFTVLTLALAAMMAFAREASALGATVNKNDIVYIRNVKSGKYIDVPGALVENNKEVQIYTGNQTVAQHWKADSSTMTVNGKSITYYTFRSMLNTDYMLCAGGGAYGEKLTIKYNPGTSSTNCRFRIASGSGSTDGVCRLESVASSLDRSAQVQQGNTANGTKITQREPFPTVDERDLQFWVFESATVRLVSVLSKLSGSNRIYLNAVDSGGHCDWTGTTEYASQFNTALAAWNTQIGSTVFQQRSGLAIEDLNVRDLATAPIQPDQSVTLAETVITNSLTYHMRITFFKNTMTSHATNNLRRIAVATHELGHVLGLGHSSIYRYDSAGNGYYENQGNIMNDIIMTYGTSFSLDDKASLAEARKHW